MNSTSPPSGLDERLRRLLGGTELASLRLRIRRYFERVDNGAAGDILRLTKLNATEHEVLTLLTGRPSRPSQSVQIHVRQLDTSLFNAGIADSLRTALELIDGPIVNRTVYRNNLQAQWNSVLSLSYCQIALSGWLQAPAAIRLFKRLSRQDPTTASNCLNAQTSYYGVYQPTVSLFPSSLQRLLVMRTRSMAVSQPPLSSWLPGDI
jgi:hypothetical protein